MTSLRTPFFLLVVVALTLPAGSQAKSPDAQKFSDHAFGFSFWYPSDWKAQDAPVTDPNMSGYLRDGRIIRSLQVQPAASKRNDQAPGVIVLEVLAPAGLTQLGGSKSASPVGVDQKYFFDHAQHQWMYASLSMGPDGSPPAISPAKPSQITMGGLNVFDGAGRHGSDVIVPLNRSHFLILSTMDVGGDFGHTFLAQTIVGTDAKAGRRATPQVQNATIRQTVAKLRALE